MGLLALDYNKTTLISIPVVKRTTERYDWMRLQSFPLVTLNSSFKDEYDVDAFESLHTSQVLSLEHFLNSILSPVVPIFITDGDFTVTTYLTSRSESIHKDLFVKTRVESPSAEPFIYNRSELYLGGIDFHVNLSSTDSALELLVRSYTDKFKPGGKLYDIVIY